MGIVEAMVAVNWTTFLIIAAGTLIGVRIFKLLMNRTWALRGKTPMRFFEPGKAWWMLDPYEFHAVWYGMLSVIGNFDKSALNPSELKHLNEKMHYFWFGQTVMIFTPALIVGYVRYRDLGWDEGYTTFLAIAGALLNRPKNIIEKMIVKLWEY
jgi:hypothetical protein